ncbi:MAG: hypothetical protein LBC27_00875 [Spirochaetaceae bacterium]|nr:hypothetical protein [Spirochaetaceae bacterium]
MKSELVCITGLALKTRHAAATLKGRRPAFAARYLVGVEIIYVARSGKEII